MHYLPALDDASQTRLARLLEAGELLPVMNDTKWSELITSMLGCPEMKPQFRLCSVLAVQGYVSDWDGDWHYHIHPVAEIEWLELRALSVEWLELTLRAYSIPYSIEAGTLRVWGYTRRGSQPGWL